MWYYLKNDEMIGSISFEEIVNLINAGVITSSTYVWQSGKKRQRASQVEELAPYFKNVTQTSSKQTPPQNAASPPDHQPQTRNPAAGVNNNVSSGSDARSRTQRRTRGSDNNSSSNKNKTGNIILNVCLVIAILCLLLLIPITSSYNAELNKTLNEFSQTGYSGSLSTSDGNEFLCIITVIVSLVALLTGFLTKQYKRTIACVIIAFICFCWPQKIYENAEQKHQEIQQAFNAIPGYEGLYERLRLLDTQCMLLSIKLRDLNQQRMVSDYDAQRIVKGLEMIQSDCRNSIIALINDRKDPAIMLRYQEESQIVEQVRADIDVITRNKP